MSYKTLDKASVSGKRVLLRVDLNLPMADGKVTDATRLERVLPTISELQRKGARVILLAHFGRPKGQVVAEMSLDPVSNAVAAAIGETCFFASDCIGEKVTKAVNGMKDGQVLLLENTRFHAGEEKNDPEFAKALAANGDIFVNDAFSAAHRAHATTVGLAKLLPAYVGRAMQAELEALEKALGKPKKPVVAVVGGAKVSTKLELLNNLIDKVDAVVIGGGMANTFLAAQGLPVGRSLCEHDLTGTANDIMAKARDVDCDFVLPTDVVVAAEFKAGAPSKTIAVRNVGLDDMILDVGPDTIEDIVGHFENAKTVVWNGPMGAFEIEPFDKGTVAAAQAVAKLTRNGKLTSVAGGGDTVAALNAADAAKDFTYVSTAGGAFLEWLEGKTLPGVAALNQ